MPDPARRNRAVLLTGGASPDPLALRPGEIVLDAGAAEVLPAGVRRIGAREILPWRESEDLTRACLEFAVSWHAGLPAHPGTGLTAGRLIESDLVIELAQALKHLVLLRRLAEKEEVDEIAADLDAPAIARIAPVLASDPRPIRLVHALGLGGKLRRFAVRMKSALPARSARPAAAGRPPRRLETNRRARVWALALYRNRPLIERLVADPGLEVRIFERSAENRYLPEGEAPRGEEAGGAWLGSETAAGAIRRAASASFGALAGAEEVALRVISEMAARLAPEAARAAAQWERLLAEDPPAAIVSGITWAGDLRSLALAAGRAGTPVVLCQDGALAELGAGGVPAGSGALAWGPLGRRWFARRGFDGASIRETGDPYMDLLLDRVRAANVREARARLGIPEGARILLAGIQNSAPHLLFTDPGDPMRAARLLARAVAAAEGWVLLLKPHPRLPLVDGSRRLQALRALAASAPHARCADPSEPIADLMAAADAFISEGDTLSLEMLRAGRSSAVLIHDGWPELYPEFTRDGAMPVVHSADEIAAWLRGGAPRGDPGAAKALVDSHLREEAAPAAALREIAGLTSPPP